jgi:hypothetical protein
MIQPVFLCFGGEMRGTKALFEGQFKKMQTAHFFACTPRLAQL